MGQMFSPGSKCWHQACAATVSPLLTWSTEEASWEWDCRSCRACCLAASVGSGGEGKGAGARLQGCFIARLRRLWRGAGLGTRPDGPDTALEGRPQGPGPTEAPCSPGSSASLTENGGGLVLQAEAGQLSQNLKAEGPVEEKRWPAGTAPPHLHLVSPCTMHRPAHRGRGLPKLRAAEVPGPESVLWGVTAHAPHCFVERTILECPRRPTAGMPGPLRIQALVSLAHSSCVSVGERAPGKEGRPQAAHHHAHLAPPQAVRTSS